MTFTVRAVDLDTTDLGDLKLAMQQVADASLTDSTALAHQEQVFDFCAQHPDALLRSCETGHLTGSAAVLEEGSGRLVLLLHAKVGLWLQPGGHADGDGDLARVSLREAWEETGLHGLRVVTPAIDIDVHTFDAPGEPLHLHLDVRHLVLAPEGSVFAANHESHDIAWVSEADLATYNVDPGVHRMLARAQVAARAIEALP